MKFASPILITLALSCSSAGDLVPSEIVEVPPPDGVHEDLYDGEVDPTNPCRVALFPEDQLVSMTKSVAGRWEKATGCDIYLGVEGVSIAYSPLPSLVCVHVEYDRLGEIAAIVLNSRVPECSTVETTLLHEIGHVICNSGSSTTHCHVSGIDETADDHVLMSSSDAIPAVSSIDSRSLQAVCSSVACSSFYPEVE